MPAGMESESRTGLRAGVGVDGEEVGGVVRVGVLIDEARHRPRTSAARCWCRGRPVMSVIVACAGSSPIVAMPRCRSPG